MACLVAKSMVFSWQMGWRTPKIGRRRHWCLPQTLCPLGAHSSNGEIWGHGQGAMPYFLQAFLRYCVTALTLLLHCHDQKPRTVCAGQGLNIHSISLVLLSKLGSKSIVLNCNAIWCRSLHFIFHYPQ